MYDIHVYTSYSWASVAKLFGLQLAGARSTIQQQKQHTRCLHLMNLVAKIISNFGRRHFPSVCIVLQRGAQPRSRNNEHDA